MPDKESTLEAQSDKFINMARALECNEDEKVFERKLKKVTKQKSDGE